jgi:L-threonylcarbamoyladenylate synthase
MLFSSDIENCLKALRTGGTILYPTDTVWGLGCDATNGEAVKKIYQIKRREESKALIVLVADEDNLSDYVAKPDQRIFEHLRKSERPTTVVYENVCGLAENLIGKDGTVAIRIVKDDFCKELIQQFSKPIVSTSANISGEASPGKFSEITETIKRSVDYIVKYRQDDTIAAQPSSVIKWDNGTIAVIRS